ncbi:centrosomin isoform X2 [Plodia interpunctella]|uniref:centrosomin isoform X2 n=1 Tax=Plodia interpunctella TaxID=58824 RepID=UPI002368C874|nr:centrosomin isoform X2 [Plodia interpunctella]
MAESIIEAVGTSPRKLQEMTLPVPDCHDVTNASGVSMKQYEEQLNGLRKENFHLKLRIYFLEEKLGNGSPPAVQGLLEHNVRLQVEVEELRRQLSDKQELLAAAAEAIDVLEQQGSISTDSVEVSMNNARTRKEDKPSDKISEKKEVCDDTCASESAGDLLDVPDNHDDMSELLKLRRENRKALQMIKGCMKKIQQQDKEIKKLKLNKELAYAHVSDSQLEKYEEILKCKDEHIKDLESKVRELQKNAENIQNDDTTGNLQQLLTRRLQGLAYFLDKLLSHKCVLGEEKKKLAESILEQSLALPVGLKLDESMAPEEFTMDESNLDISQSFRIEDLTMMFGHHVMCSGDDNKCSSRKPLKHFPQADVVSESECWSEPDRNVSLARVGLCDTGVNVRESTSENNRYRSRRSRVSYGSRSEDNKTTNESAMLDEINQLTQRNELLEEENVDLKSKIEFAQKQIDELISEKDELKSVLNSERTSHLEARKDLAVMKNSIMTLELEIETLKNKLTETTQLIEKLRIERQELESTYMETERALRRAADEATVQASQAALERARAQHDRLKIERELEETREKLSCVMETNAKLELEATRRVAIEIENKAVMQRDALSEEDRPTSPDLGIDSDRLSSLEQNDAATLSPRSLYEENQTLKQKLARTKATLADTLSQLNAANLRKRSVQRAICREIHKTQGVLRKARDQFENQN